MAWLSGWSYRKEITITGQAGAGTNYQVDLDIGDSAGGDFHLENHCTNFPQDIQVTDNDGETLLDFWIEDITADPLKMWVEVADDLGTNKTIYVYYGKSAETTDSDGDATFVFFDGFNRADSSTVGNGWTDLDSWIIKDNELYLASMVSTQTISRAFTHDDYVFELKIRSSNNSGKSLGFKGYGDVANRRWNFNITIDGKIYGLVLNDVWVEIGNYSANTWYNLRLNYKKSSGKVDYIVDGVGSLIDQDPYGTASTNQLIITTGTTLGSFFQIDNFKVRKYVATEPAFSSAGSEQTSIKSMWYYQMLKRRN